MCSPQMSACAGRTVALKNFSLGHRPQTLNEFDADPLVWWTKTMRSRSDLEPPLKFRPVPADEDCDEREEVKHALPIRAPPPPPPPPRTLPYRWMDWVKEQMFYRFLPGFNLYSQPSPEPEEADSSAQHVKEFSDVSESDDDDAKPGAIMLDKGLCRTKDIIGHSLLRLKQKYSNFFSAASLHKSAVQILRQTQSSAFGGIETEGDATGMVREVLKSELNSFNASFETHSGAKIGEQRSRHASAGNIVRPDMVVSQDERSLIVVEVKRDCNIRTRAMDQHETQLRVWLDTEEELKCVFGMVTSYERWIFTTLVRGAEQATISRDVSLGDADVNNTKSMERVLRYIRAELLLAHERNAIQFACKAN